MTISHEEFEDANRRGVELKDQFSEVIAVQFDSDRNHLTFERRSGVKLTIPTYLIRGFENARPGDFVNFEISPSGLGVYFPNLDVDIYIPAFLIASKNDK